MRIDLRYAEGILDDEGCRRTLGAQTTEPHLCPYKHDMNGDTTTLCTCSAAQQNECGADI